MAKIYISEFQFMGANGYDQADIARQPAILTQVVDFTAGATASAAFSAATTFVRAWSDTKCCLKFGTAPVATTSDMPLSLGVSETFGVAPGQKLSAITLT